MIALLERGRDVVRRARLAQRGLFLWLHPWAYLSNIVLTPVVNIGLYALSAQYARDGVQPAELALGVSATAIPYIVLGGVLQSFYYDQVYATHATSLTCPANSLVNAWVKRVGHVGHGALSGLAATLFTVALFGREWPRADAAGVLLAILAMSWSCLAFAQFFGVWVSVLKNWLLLLGVTNSLLFCLSGAVIPRPVLPSGLAALGEVLPLTHGLVALRHAMRGDGLGIIQGDLFREVAVGALYALAASVALKRVEYRARRDGIIEV